jgi:hypothetical protein
MIVQACAMVTNATSYGVGRCVHLIGWWWSYYKFILEYVNHSNNKTKVQYSSYEWECLVIIWAISSFLCYLYGSPFILIIDHQPLGFLMELNMYIRK